MNHTITLPELVKLLSTATNCSEATAQQFVTELFSTIGDALSEGKSVKVKNIGTFAPDALNRGEIKYLPDADLAEAVNHPFAFFEPVELDDELTDDELDAVATLSQEDRHEAEQPEEPIEDPAKEFDEEPTEQEESQAQSVETQAEEHLETTAESIVEKDPETVAVDIPETEESNEHRGAVSPDKYPGNENADTNHRSHSNPWLMFAAGLLTGVVVGYLLPTLQEGISSLMRTDKIIIEQAEPIEQTEIETEEIITSENDSADTATTPVDTVPTATAVNSQSTQTTDTIGRNRFLTTMSRKYYGRFEFWVYIYEENASQLAHPDKIKPGTVVTIPPAKKYGIDPHDAQSVLKATQKADEIYQRFQK